MRLPSEELRRARRAFEDLPGAKLLGDWTWHDTVGKWALPCRLQISAGTDPNVPGITDWFFLVGADYPWGDIKVHPAKDRGLSCTFQHQMYNGPSNSDRPWTDGYICTQGPLVQLGRAAGSKEPFDADLRLAWYVRQTLDWLTAASRGQLVSLGDPFELPHYSNGSGVSIATLENAETFGIWSSSTGTLGYVELYQLKAGRGSTYCVQAFYGTAGTGVVEYNWGRGTQTMLGGQHLGIWIMAKSLPILAPWQVPATLGELAGALREQGIEIVPLILQLAHRLRDGTRHPLLIGAPIPDRIGTQPSRVHWSSFLLPVLSNGAKKAAGFRANEQGYHIRDAREILRPDTILNWNIGENWSDDQFASRGRWALGMAMKRYVMLGAGALGSAVGELLVRAGVQDLHIMDHETFVAGNSRRHTLGLDSLEMPKSKELASRLNLANPNARVIGSDCAFPSSAPSDIAAIDAADVIIDCTANDQVLHDLSRPRTKATLLISVSMGLRAKRLYCYAEVGTCLNHDRFIEATRPWLERDITEYPGELPREAIGCWHPVFPARADDVWAMAVVAAKEIERLSETPPHQPTLAVFEQREEEGTFTGVIRVNPQ